MAATTAAAAAGQSISVTGAAPKSSRPERRRLKLISAVRRPARPPPLSHQTGAVSIYDIPVARITDEYLRYLNMMQSMDIAVASDFLVMAAQLIEIKSRMLLPPDPSLTDEDAELLDPRRELIDRLLEHQKFKAAAEMLWSRATVERAVYARAPIETDKSNPEVAAGAFDLLRVFQEILARRKEEVLMEIERDEMTMYGDAENSVT